MEQVGTLRLAYPQLSFARLCELALEASFIANMDQNCLDDFKDKVSVYQTTVCAGDVLIVPPGWMCASLVQEDKLVIGIRSSFVGASDLTFSVMKFLMDVAHVKQIEPLVKALSEAKS